MENTTLEELNKDSKKKLLRGLLLLTVGCGLLTIFICFNIDWWLDYPLLSIPLLAIPIGLGGWIIFMSCVELLSGNKNLQESNDACFETNKLERDDYYKHTELFDKKLKTYIAEYGELTKNISYEIFEFLDMHDFEMKRIPIIDKSFLVFESSSIFVVENKTIKFKDLISFRVNDNTQKIYSGSVATSKTNTGNMFGRAVVGGVLGGGIGAVIGGSTAKKEIEISGQTSWMTHDYEIVITINSIESPTIKMHLGENRETMQEIASILSIIIERNE